MRYTYIKKNTLRNINVYYILCSDLDEMRTLVLITSIIDTPHTPLSYCANRSVYSKAERYEQTKKTISSVRSMIPDCKICLVECSSLTEDEQYYFDSHCDYVLNLWNQTELHNDIFGLSKALGEGTMTIKALEYIMKSNIEYDNLIKITGRYWLTDKFNYETLNNDKMVFKRINTDSRTVFTMFYKIHNSHTKTLYDFLILHIPSMHNCVGYETLFGLFVQQFDNIIYINGYIGMAGYIAVAANEYFEN